ncbi:MAG: hypothetical protein M1816_008022 [Peltula sp. TS41687]|nr:MAG: hypothetical protein M1816_008022 [Peltula sp. TS41687]
MSHRRLIRHRYGITTCSLGSIYLPLWLPRSSAADTPSEAHRTASTGSDSSLPSSDELTLSPIIISKTNSTQNASSTDRPSSTSTFPTPIALPPGQTPPGAPSPHAQRDASLVNVYFLLLGLFILVVIFGWWAFHRRKKRKIAMLQDIGRSALVRDLEGWAGTRRWIYGGWRGIGAGSGGNNRRSPEEGLDANGEAPPPYKPPAAIEPENSQVLVGDGHRRNDSMPPPPPPPPSRHRTGSNHTLNGSASISIADTLSIPLRTLSGMTRGMGWGRGPPDYEATEASRDRGLVGFNAARAVSDTSRPLEKTVRSQHAKSTTLGSKGGEGQSSSAGSRS